ncbi:hypothetical protein KDU71_07155 [Carboxylicivirga sediminis]|uniref:Uncharacterized protein n=1 Tax=Carboxylicivirga sediminis TaxID=2006564 RepID=A0A941IY14_9BACT|nr:hypothetical protein [Carboxylicivirga sediminis]MBR8535332.1 hypothetical protein [Carboxylicivirga sediminis]
MKNILLYSVLIVFISVFVACDDDDDTNFLPSTTVGVDVDEVTIFDSPFTVNFTTSNTNVSELVINGGEVADMKVAISDMKGSSTFDMTDFGSSWAIGKGESFSTTVDFGSSQSVSYFSVAVVEALAAELSAATIAEYDSAMSEVTLSGATMFNALGNVVVERKIITEAEPNPAFVEMDSDTPGNEYEYTEEYYGVDYNLNDTIVYKITATSGAHVETTMIELPVVSKMLPDVSAEALDATNSPFAFMPVKDGDDVGVLTFVSPRSISSADVMFVEIEEGNQVELFAELNTFSTLVEIVDAAALSATITDAAIGEVYAFMYDFEDVSYYGYMTITEIHSTDIGDAMDGIEFTYTQDVRQ